MRALLFFWSLLSLAVQASVVGYDAHYQIWSAEGKTLLGYYQVDVQPNMATGDIVQHGKIGFSWNTLFSQGTYRYRDEVRYDSDGYIHWRIDESRDRVKRLIQGYTSAAGATLVIVQEGQSQTLLIPAESFDYTLFDLRFPHACGKENSNKTMKARLLDPGTGKVNNVEHHYLNYSDSVPFQAPLNQGKYCMVETESDRKEMKRRSWLNQDGYLIYEVSSVYRIKLVPEASNLPVQNSRSQ